MFADRPAPDLAEKTVLPEIQRRLQSIEEGNGVRILLACESGSRAWGFASRDSDYDVRFIYLHRPEWYLSIDVEEKRDVIECPIDNTLDINGWDLRKALRLFQKSNPPLLEWLGSPIVYLEFSTLSVRMRGLTHEFYSPKACRYHYLHMAQGNFREYLKGRTVSVKKYFYVLRPLLAIRWIAEGPGVVPTEFGVLVNRLLPRGSEVRIEIEKLIALKRAGAELDRGPRIEAISRFIEQELARHEEGNESPACQSSSPESLNRLFRDVLSEVWPRTALS